MAKLSPGKLISYLDDELNPKERQEVDKHLADSAEARHQLEQLRSQRERLSTHLEALRPDELETSRSGYALRKLYSAANKKENYTMENLQSNRQLKRVMTGVVVVVVLIGLFAMPPVRALASDLLSIFRVENFVAVEFEMERLEEVAQAVGEDTVFGEHEMLNEPAAPTQVTSIEEAEQLVDFNIRRLRGETPSAVFVSGRQEMRFTPDIVVLRDLFTTLGLDPELLPAEIDGQPFDITLPAGVELAYSMEEDGSKEMFFTQMPSPTVDVPDNVDIQELGVAMLQLLGMSEEEAQRFSESVDFTTTLVMPVPSDMLTAREVVVGDSTGLLFTPSDEDYSNEGLALMWQDDGMLYMVITNADNEAWLLSMVESFR